MKYLLLVLLLAASTPLLALDNGPEIRVYFSPKGGCEDAVVKEINRAQKTVLVQAYSFTNKEIAAALVKAKKRLVKVEVILDKSQLTEEYSEADFLAHAKIRTLIDSKHAIAHNKVMILDDETVITGSFNFTNAAEDRNAENLLVIKSKDLAAKYDKNWREHEKHSKEYWGK